MTLSSDLRPKTLEDFVGQEHLVGKGKIIQNLLDSGAFYSLIFWGPPGVGKTTLANIIAAKMGAKFYALSGVTSGKKDLQQVIEDAQINLNLGQKTLLFVDEIHRWNKAQQDALLPFVETGLITLIGATTENPSFEIIAPLLSRTKIFVLEPLSFANLEKLIDRALTDKTDGLGKYKKKISANATELLINLSGGDARIVLNAIEMAVQSYPDKKITPQIIEDIFQTRSTGLYDKKGEEHYNLISAFIKSVRGSSPDAALYYLARILGSGEDPKFIARRLIILASEDIGLADRGALIQANAAFEAVQKIGMPEAQLTLAHVTLYLSLAKKSRAVANALGKAQKLVFEHPNLPVPLHLRNAPTKLMKDLGYAKGYTWSATHVGPKKDLSFLPEKIKGEKVWEEGK